MHSFDLNLVWVGDEEEEERRLSAEALGSSSSSPSDEELNGFIDYFLHGSDSNDASQSISRSRVRNEGMDFVDLGLGFDLGSDTNNEEASFDLNVTVSELGLIVQDVESGFQSFSSSSSMREEEEEVELVCEEDFRVLVNESNTNNQAPRPEVVRVVENEIEFDYNDDDAMMVDPPDDDVDIEEGLEMIINAADDDGDGSLLVHNVMYEDIFDQFLGFADDNGNGDDDNGNGDDVIGIGDDGINMMFWTQFLPAEWDNNDDTSWSMQTIKCDVDSLPSVTLTQEELNKGDSICAICMENFCIEEKLKKLPCLHYYHVDCISPWLRTRNTCPTCRYELPLKQ